ncbi:cell division protein FtsL [Govanella unica]|uniref:Cell division protein FtsL n=1 Tax=Govanella unica TaxID=2975056 RepID=A0A9X3U0G9_9PROT|nr:hypothetical protein [Govania unica]MDA5195071.1 hypothetical protein [Govania unica]
MKRSFNLLAVVIIVAAGVALYQLKYRTQRLQDEVRGLQSQIVNDTEALKVLNAEWTYLSRPDRLEALGRRYLALDAVKAGQVIASLDNVPMREDSTIALAQVDDFRAAGGPQLASSGGETGSRPMVRPVPLPGHAPQPAATESRPLLQVRHEPTDGNPTAFLKTLKYVQAGGLND